jgi:predicted metal-binding membrane protein
LAVGRAGLKFEPWLAGLGLISLAAWSMLALGTTTQVLPTLCLSGAGPKVPLSVSFDLAFLLNSPASLASGWALMLAAMMLPVIAAPLRHVRDRSFARRRVRATLLFVLGYFAVWMAVGAVLQAVALTARSVAFLPLALGVAFAAAIAWQVSPAKQWCLNRCHRRPQLAAFGLAADCDALNFGLSSGAACAGACWALMLSMLLAGDGKLLAMIAVTLLVFAERLERPAPLKWRWRGTGKAIRIIVAQARLIGTDLSPSRNPGFRRSADHPRC